MLAVQCTQQTPSTESIAVAGSRRNGESLPIGVSPVSKESEASASSAKTSVFSEDHRQQSPAKTGKELQGEPMLEPCPLSVGLYLYLYPFQISHVLSTVCSRKTSRVCSQENILSWVCFGKTSSHKTVSRKTSHDTTESQTKPEIPTSDHYCTCQPHRMCQKEHVTHKLGSAPCTVLALGLAPTRVLSIPDGPTQLCRWEKWE